MSEFGSQDSAIGVATSTTLDVGSWTDHGSTGVKSSSAKPYNAIDANLINADGTYLLTWGSFWGDIYQAEMKASPLTLASGTSSYQVAYDPVTTALEGSYVFKYGSYYYLFYSKGQCCGYDQNMPAAGGEYKIMVCRSTSATGGYVDKSGAACTSGGGTVVLESHDNVYGPGGQGVYQDPTYGPVRARSRLHLPYPFLWRMRLTWLCLFRSFTTTMLTRPLAMRTAISDLVGIPLTSRAAGLLCNANAAVTNTFIESVNRDSDAKCDIPKPNLHFSFC